MPSICDKAITLRKLRKALAELPLDNEQRASASASLETLDPLKAKDLLSRLNGTLDRLRNTTEEVDALLKATGSLSVTPSLFTGTINDVVWLRIEGPGSFQISMAFKKSVQSHLERGLSSFVVDLELCSGLDSTFMGTLLWAASRSAENCGKFKVVNADGWNGRLIRGLGLDQLFEVSEGPEGTEGWLREKTLPQPQFLSSPREQRTVILEAHEALASMGESNEKKFRESIEIMREELQMD